VVSRSCLLRDEASDPRCKVRGMDPEELCRLSRWAYSQPVEGGKRLPRSRGVPSLVHSVYLIVVQVNEKPRFANSAAVRSFCQRSPACRNVRGQDRWWMRGEQVVKRVGVEVSCRSGMSRVKVDVCAGYKARQKSESMEPRLKIMRDD
jgi:hypothetical protein